MTNPKPQYRQFLISAGLAVLALAAGFGVSHGLTLLKQPPVLREPVERVYNVEVFDVENLTLREIVRGLGTSEAEREVVL